MENVSGHERPELAKRCITVENDIWAYGEKEEKGGASTQIKTNRQRMVPLLGGGKLHSGWERLSYKMETCPNVKGWPKQKTIRFTSLRTLSMSAV